MQFIETDVNVTCLIRTISNLLYYENEPRYVMYSMCGCVHAYMHVWHVNVNILGNFLQCIYFASE